VANSAENLVEVKVPDIGDFKDVPVIEVFVKVGDQIDVDTPLLTLESDKATIEVPAPSAGIIQSLQLKVGDKVSAGTLILKLEPSSATDKTETPKQAPNEAPIAATQSGPADALAPTAAASPSATAASTTTPSPASSPSLSAASSTAPASAPPTTASSIAALPHDIECDLLVLGAGPGGYSAAFRAADLGMKVVLVERYPTLGGVCLNVGCIPSKALLHAAKVMDEVADMRAHGIDFGAPKIDLDKLRDWKSGVVGKLTLGLTGMAKARKVQVVQGLGKFIGPNHLAVETTAGKKVVQFKNAIIAAGSQPVKLPFIPDDPRIVDSTGALELRAIPKHLLVLGGGIIGLEMATVYGALGAKVSVVEMLDGLMPGTDRDLVKVWEKRNAKHFDKVMLKTRVTAVEAKKDGLLVTFESEKVEKTEGASASPENAKQQTYDMLLVAVGRTPNGKQIDADKAGVNVSERGFIEVDNQMRTNVPHIFAIGDIVGQPMLAHKAVHEGHVAAEVAAGEKRFFDATVIPSVAYTDPEIAWVGITEEQAKAQNIKIEKGLFPWAASGRAIANGRDEGFTKLLFDAETHRIVGGGIVGTQAGDLIGEIALAIEMGCDAIDIGKTIHPHPTLSESIGMAAEAFEGVCTDLPPTKKKAP